MNDKHEIVTLTYDSIKAESGMAWLFDFGGEECWLPKSQVEDIRETSKEVDLPLWLVISDQLEGYIT